MQSAMSLGDHWFCLTPPKSYTCIEGWEVGKEEEGREGRKRKGGEGERREGEDYSEVQLYCSVSSIHWAPYSHESSCTRLGEAY